MRGQCNACSLLDLPDFPEFAQAVRYVDPATPGDFQSFMIKPAFFGQVHEVRLLILIVLLILFLVVIPSNLTLLWRLVVATLPSVLFTLQSRVDGTLAGPPNKDMQVQESKASQ